MVVPLTCGALITTFAPHTAEFFGSFTGALFTGAIPILAVFFICFGSTIPMRALPTMVKRGGVLMATKVGIGIVIGYVLGHLIAFQVEQHLDGKDKATFGKEFERVARLGKISPDLWMVQATGKPVGTDSLLGATKTALKSH